MINEKFEVLDDRDGVSVVEVDASGEYGAGVLLILTTPRGQALVEMGPDIAEKIAAAIGAGAAHRRTL